MVSEAERDAQIVRRARELRDNSSLTKVFIWLGAVLGILIGLTVSAKFAYEGYSWLTDWHFNRGVIAGANAAQQNIANAMVQSANEGKPVTVNSNGKTYVFKLDTAATGGQ